MALVKIGRQEKSSVEPCPHCTDLTLNNGLLKHEQNLTIDALLDLSDTTGSIEVLRTSAQHIIDGHGATFATVYGDTGSAKSLWAKIIVASLCRNGVQARYTRGVEVEQALFRVNMEENGNAGKIISHRPGIETLARIRALVIDEAQTINWRNEWISKGIQEVLDRRYERATAGSPQYRQLTIFVAQHDPKEWAPDYLYDRMRQGTFSIPWTGDVPECLQHRPCPACGGVMEYNGEYVACTNNTEYRSLHGTEDNGIADCYHSYDTEIFWPFKDMAKSARPIMPARKFNGWS